jgi:hypothetical protein
MGEGIKLKDVSGLTIVQVHQSLIQYIQITRYIIHKGQVWQDVACTAVLVRRG